VAKNVSPLKKLKEMDWGTSGKQGVKEFCEGESGNRSQIEVKQM
jgi:hypothetical protein